MLDGVLTRLEKLTDRFEREWFVVVVGVGECADFTVDHDGHDGKGPRAFDMKCLLELVYTR